jgi:hypothetical protein
MILRITAKLNEAPFHLAGTDAKREPELAWLKVLQNYIVEATAYKAFPKDLLGRG